MSVPMKELINQINTTFKVDMLSGKRNFTVLWFRYYIVDKMLLNSVAETAEVMKRDHKNVINLRKKIPMIRNRNEFIAISKVVESMDVKIYEEFLQSCTYIEKADPLKKPRMAEAISVLRKDNACHLWNKLIQKWDKKDMEVYENLKNKTTI